MIFDRFGVRLRASLVVVATSVLVAGCASYEAKPLPPAQTAAALERRTLSDPALSRFIAAASPSYAAEAGSWDISTLTLAALYYHPEIDISRNRLALAQAGIVTARQVPNPTITVAPGNGLLASEAPSPLTIGFLINFVIETFGKRDIRIEQATNATEAARQDLASAAWQVRGGVRTSLLDLWASEGRLKLATRRLALQQRIVDLLERRFGAGESSALDVARERINLSQVAIALRDSERQAGEARARLAAAVGIPARSIEQVTIVLTTFDNPPSMPDVRDMSEGGLRQRALLERTDVLGLLAEYEASQSAVRLEIAKQYPNISVGPGYAFDRGDNLYNFELSVDLPIFNQNQGPIAEALARRREAAAKFVALQAKVIGDIDRAVASYRGAVRTVATANTLLASQRDRRRQIDRAFQLGEVDRMAPLTADLEEEVVQLARYEAVIQQREAMAMLEDALQQSLFDGGYSFIRLPQRVSGRPDILDTVQSPVPK
ncbi:MAG: hypothetical protein ABS35_18895 [Kaistia sp. SCN 65-12]|nr:MAG: hypothetical protein ABS35_18895 [Kaistia sp. SCN 65-12]